VSGLSDVPAWSAAVGNTEPCGAATGLAWVRSCRRSERTSEEQYIQRIFPILTVNGRLQWKMVDCRTYEARMNRQCIATEFMYCEPRFSSARP
jgi:hypothetical protein